MNAIGLILIIIGFADVVLSWFGVDITGVIWSPYVFFGIGALFQHLAKKQNGEAK